MPLREDELRNRLAELNELPPHEQYATIHDFGRADYLAARPDVERFLTSDDPELRYIALEVLTRHWNLAEHWETARRFLEHDPDTDCRLMGASALEALKQNTRDTRTLGVLARVVRNEQEQSIVRRAAYRAMLGVLRHDPKEQFELASQGDDLPAVVDWAMVDHYLPE